MTLYHVREHIKMLLKRTPVSALLKCRDKWRSQRASKYLKKYGLEAASDICDAISSLSVRFYLTCGSLLGIVRDGTFMEYDDDLDFALEIIDGTEWAMVHDVLVKRGYQLFREWSIDGVTIERCYCGNHISFDIFGCFPSGDNLRMHTFMRYDTKIYDSPDHFSVEYFTLPKPAHIIINSAQGKQLLLPDNADQQLAIFYGPNWRVPDPNWVNGTYSISLNSVRGKKTEFSIRH